MEGVHQSSNHEQEQEWSGQFDLYSDVEEQRVIFAALDSFRQYRKSSHYNVTHRRRQNLYAIPSIQWQLLAEKPFSLFETLNQVDDALDFNADVAELILEHGLKNFGLPTDPISGSDKDWKGAATASDMAKAHSTIRQFFRDWSNEGRQERTACYEPVHRCLREIFRSPTGIKVLVPGAGLGRLVFDLCEAGYNVEGNEISYHQLLGSSWILNHTPKAKAYPIYPFAHQFTNIRTRSQQLQEVSIPDLHPGEALGAASSREGRVGEMSMTAADFVVLYASPSQRNSFDAVATVFFIDTAPNLFRYIAAVKNCLTPDGVWINVGPLLWHFDDRLPGDNAQKAHQGGSRKAGDDTDLGIGELGGFELTDEEVLALVERSGFRIESHEVRNEGVGYIQDPESMLQNLYRISYWTARKIDEKKV